LVLKRLPWLQPWLLPHNTRTPADAAMMQAHKKKKKHVFWGEKPRFLMT
jgi:hypothetical protein